MFEEMFEDIDEENDEMMMKIYEDEKMTKMTRNILLLLLLSAKKHPTKYSVTRFGVLIFLKKISHTISVVPSCWHSESIFWPFQLA